MKVQLYILIRFRTMAAEVNGRTINWGYDGIYRLSNEAISNAPSGKNGTVAYTLDPVGNRLSDSSSLSGVTSASSTFDADDRLASESYDSDGNTISIGGKTFSFDSENHLVSINGGTATILYDGDGNRVAKTIGGVTTRSLVTDLNPTGYPQVVEELVNSAVTREYSYGLQRIDEYQELSNTWTPSFYGYDGGGTVQLLTNTAGSITDTYEFDAWGNKVSTTGTTPNNFLYRAEQYDSDLGLYYLRARYMNPLTGRFVNRDPSNGIITDPKTLHKYLYADGDPVNLADPTGRAGEAVVKPYTPGALEYGLILTYVSLQAAKSLPAVAAGVNCILDTAASLLQGVSTDMTAPIESITFGSCRAKVKRGCAPEEVNVCVTLFTLCKGKQCGSCLNYCTTQCEWPFHRCNKLHEPYDPGPLPSPTPPGRIQ